MARNRSGTRDIRWRAGDAGIYLRIRGIWANETTGRCVNRNARIESEARSGSARCDSASAVIIDLPNDAPRDSSGKSPWRPRSRVILREEIQPDFCTKRS